MPVSEKLKRKLLTPDEDRYGRVDGRTGVTLYALSTIVRMAGTSKIQNIY